MALNLCPPRWDQGLLFISSFFSASISPLVNPDPKIPQLKALSSSSRGLQSRGRRSSGARRRRLGVLCHWLEGGRVVRSGGDSLATGSSPDRGNRGGRLGGGGCKALQEEGLRRERLSRGRSDEGRPELGSHLSGVDAGWWRSGARRALSSVGAHGPRRCGGEEGGGAGQIWPAEEKRGRCGPRQWRERSGSPASVKARGRPEGRSWLAGRRGAAGGAAAAGRAAGTGKGMGDGVRLARERRRGFQLK
ncbi:hypothetical protein J5N97_030300 [Dioscorea zingiberensis]|uniref:Uncharacterized protein n=1 Tax=Dioscorea zingiberensis TaxID=325984 RepID=A0A9D5BXE9_9LILI|nr:hypothetical protein J5N97_030300 [Dioscorea zingiberensis]